MSVAAPAILSLVVMGLIASEIVAGQLRTGRDGLSARRTSRRSCAVYVDPTISEDYLDLGAEPDPTIDAQLTSLTASGDILRINIWSRDGRAVYSTQDDLRGHRFSIDHDLATRVRWPERRLVRG